MRKIKDILSKSAESFKPAPKYPKLWLHFSSQERQEMHGRLLKMAALMKCATLAKATIICIEVGLEALEDYYSNQGGDKNEA